jgi:hypothetical protein
LLALLIGLARMLPAGQAAMQLGIFDPIACAATQALALWDAA